MTWNSATATTNGFGLGKKKKDPAQVRAEAALNRLAYQAQYAANPGRGKMRDKDAAAGRARQNVKAAVAAAKQAEKIITRGTATPKDLKALQKATARAGALSPAIRLAFPVFTQPGGPLSPKPKTKAPPPGTPGAPFPVYAPTAPVQMPGAPTMSPDKPLYLGPATPDPAYQEPAYIPEPAYPVDPLYAPAATADPMSGAPMFSEPAYIPDNMLPGAEQYPDVSAFYGPEDAVYYDDALQVQGIGFLNKIVKGAQKLIKNNKNTIGTIVRGVTTGQNPLTIAANALTQGRAKTPAMFLPQPPQTSPPPPAPAAMPQWVVPAAIIGGALLLSRR